MVLIHYKKTDHNQFLVEVSNETPIEQLIEILVTLNNLRIEADLFACALEDLASHGPLKPEQIRGLDTQELIDNALVVSSEDRKLWGKQRQLREDERSNQDPTRFRIGIIKNQHITQMLIDTSNKAKKLISYKNAQQKINVTVKELQDVIQEMGAALKIAYPNYQGLGDWETAVEFAEGRYDLSKRNTNTIDFLEAKETTLWVVGKEYMRGKLLKDYIKNDKTKVIAKLTKEGSGAPMRQPQISEEQNKAMMAHFHKKQEEMKKLQTNNQDDYLGSPWANPNNLKSYLVNGGGGIQWKAGK